MSFSSLSNFITAKTRSLSNFVGGSLPGVFGDLASEIVNNIGNDLSAQVTKFTSQIVVGSNQTLSSILANPTSAIAAFAFSGIPGLIDASSGGPDGTRAQGSLLPNVLNKYASFDTIFTLAALSADEINFPDQTYRSGELSNVIIKTGGGAGPSKVTTPFETRGRVEYFIDNVEVESIIAPGNTNGISTAIGLRFTVYEPYSLGMFLQSVKIACKNSGFDNHVGAPMLLKMEFVGWDDDGNSYIAENSTRMIPFSIMDMKISVNESGSVYNVEGVATNGEAMFDEIQTLKNDVSITGKDVIEILQTGPESLATKINERFFDMEQNDKASTADRVIISIPQNLLSSRFGGSAPSSYVSNSSAVVRTDLPPIQNTTRQRGSSIANVGAAIDSVTSGTLLNGSRPTSNPSQSSQASQSTEDVGFNQQRTETGVLYLSGSSKSVLSTIESDARSNVGPLGKFKMTKDFKASGTVPFALPTVVHDKLKKVNIRFDANFQISEDKRKFTFIAGTKIEDVIQNIILFSEYHERLIDQFDNIPATGMIDWFRIETAVYIIEDKEEMARSGRYPRVYVYRVVPYQISHSVLKAPNASTVGLGNLKASAVKQYQYIYTGQNKDILEFNIEFNHAYIQPLTASWLAGGERKLSSDNVNINKIISTDTAKAGSTVAVEGAGRTQEVNELGGISIGIPQKSAIQQAAQDIHNSFLNSNADLIQLDLTILGDPYFIPDSGIGNFTDANGPNPNIKRSGSLNYQDGEVDVNVIFRTPIDYNDRGTMDFIGAGEQDGEIIEGFSGLYRVITVTHLVNENMFTQKLTMIRHKNQKEGTSADVSAIKQGSSVNSPIKDATGSSAASSGSVTQFGRSGPI